MSILNYMKEEHRECDTIFAKAEEAVALGEWEVAGERFLAFSKETLLHFRKEEEELFPAFEKQTGMTEGPTKVMRYEHEQVRGIITNMAKALEDKDKDARSYMPKYFTPIHKKNSEKFDIGNVN